MKYFFIGGIATSGKSFLAEKIAKAKNIIHVDVDVWWKEMEKDPALEPWVNFYWKLNEEEYFKNTSCDEQWRDFKNQSEGLWPEIKCRIDKIIKSGKPAIFEGVGLLPHLIKRDFNFPGIFLLGKSFEETFKRNKKAPRWGKTEALKKIEAENIFYCDRIHYKQEAEKFRFKTFEDINEAGKEILQLMR